jgi:hypothetical protein
MSSNHQRDLQGLRALVTGATAGLAARSHCASRRISGRVVRTSCIQREMAMLKAALNWGCTQYDGEMPLLERNPLQQFRVPRERDPKRPLLSEGDIDRLLSVAGRVSPVLPTLIVLARNTGRRISSILGLKWDDVDPARISPTMAYKKEFLDMTRFAPAIQRRRRHLTSRGPLRRLRRLALRERLPPVVVPREARNLPQACRENPQFPQSNPNTGGKPTTTIAAQTEYAGR